MTVLAIDQGTSGTKALVVDPVEGIVAVAEIPLRPSYLPEGGVEQDPRELLDSVLEAGRMALASARRPVDAVAFANQGETVLAWDRATGTPLSPAIVWQDRRAGALCAEIAGDAEWIATRSGLVLDPYFSAPKMAWLRRNVTTEGVVTTSDSWVVHRLTGGFVTDASTASRSLLLDIDSVAWDGGLLDVFGLSDEALPSIVSCDEVVGSTSAFGGDLPVAGLIVDQQAALLAESCLDAGMAKCTFGTGAFLLANTGATAVRSESGLTSSVAWRTREGTAYCIDGQVYTAASAVSWMEAVGLISAPDQLDAVAAADPGGVVCVPAFAGLAAPRWAPNATASLAGITLSTQRGQLVLAVLQGIAAQVAELVGLVGDEQRAALSRMRADGGLTRCRTLMQAIADLCQIPVDVFPSQHATALGAAALGRLALDHGLALRAAVRDWQPAETFEPRWPTGRAAEFLHRWSAAVTANLEASS